MNLSSKTRKNLNIFLGIAISAVCLYLTARLVKGENSWAAFGGQLKSSLLKTKLEYVAIGIFFFAIHFLGRAQAWVVIVNPMKKVGFKSIFYSTLIGFMANNILPFRAGEFIRAYALSRSEAIPVSSSLATVILARVFDTLGMLTILLMIILACPLPPEVKAASYVFFPAVACLFVFLLALKFREETTLKLINTILKPLPPSIGGFANRMVRSFLPGLETLRSLKDLTLAYIYTLSCWAGLYFYVLFFLYAFSLYLPWYAPFAILLIIALALTIPSSPGYVGVYHGSCVLSMKLFNVDDTTAFAFAILLHAVQYTFTTLLGLICLYQSRLTISEIKTEDETQKAGGREVSTLQ